MVFAKGSRLSVTPLKQPCESCDDRTDLHDFELPGGKNLRVCESCWAMLSLGRQECAHHMSESTAHRALDRFEKLMSCQKHDAMIAIAKLEQQVRLLSECVFSNEAHPRHHAAFETVGTMIAEEAT